MVDKVSKIIPKRNFICLFLALVLGSVVLSVIWSSFDWVGLPVWKASQKDSCQENTQRGLETGIGRLVNCSEHRQIVYIKNPKTGSTTFTSLLRKFGFTRCLTFAVPRHARRNIRFTVLNNETVRPPPPGRQFDILYHRLDYDHDAIAAMFSNNTLLVTSIREPFSRFVSAFKYYNYSQFIARKTKKYNKNLWFYIREYLRHPVRYDSRGSRWSSKVLNRVPEVLGIPEEKFNDVQFVKKYLQDLLKSDSWMVIITERYDESLVLLRRKLCWKLSDIIYIPLRVSPETRFSTRHPPNDIKKLYKSLARTEYLIYDSFESVVWKNMTADVSEEDLIQEVRWFKIVLKIIWRFCDRDNLIPSSPSISADHVTINGSLWNEVFDFSRRDCDLLLVQDFAFRRKIQLRDNLQRKKWYQNRHSVWWKWLNW